jgi:hypothetical protein
VHAAALVAGGNLGEEVGGFEAEGLEEEHVAAKIGKWGTAQRSLPGPAGRLV